MAGRRLVGVAMAAGLATLALSDGLRGQTTTPGNNNAATVRPGGTVAPRRALNINIDQLNVDNVPLERVLNYLRDTAAINLVVNWKVLESANVTRTTPITLTVTDVPLRKVLRLVLDQASPEKTLVYTIDSNVMSVTTEEEADKVLVTKVYIVDDLVMTNNNPSPPPMMNLAAVTASGNTSGGTGTTTGGGNGSLFQTPTATTTDEDTPQKRGEDLATLIREVVRPTIWKENGGTATVRYMSGKLIVLAPASVQEAIGGPMAPEGGQRLGGF